MSLPPNILLFPHLIMFTLRIGHCYIINLHRINVHIFLANYITLIHNTKLNKITHFSYIIAPTKVAYTIKSRKLLQTYHV